MQVIQQMYNPAVYTNKVKKSLIIQFFTWCEEQEKNRFLWIAAILFCHGCLITPITGLAITLVGNSMWLWSFAIAAMAMALVTILAAMPTKATIPVFFFSLLIDLGILINCIAVLVI